jgi:predicted nucleic acid-binding protein
VYRIIAGHLAAEWKGIEVVSLGDDVRDLAKEVLERHPLRASDAVQLASALKIHQVRAIKFGAADKRLRKAAALEGFELLDLSS